jgi:hypothetical protein
MYADYLRRSGTIHGLDRRHRGRRVDTTGNPVNKFGHHQHGHGLAEVALGGDYLVAFIIVGSGSTVVSPRCDAHATIAQLDYSWAPGLVPRFKRNHK